MWYQIEAKINPFHLMVTFANYLICIFMNINENIKKSLKTQENHRGIPGANLTYLAPQDDFKCKSFIGTPEMLLFIVINLFAL